MCRLKMCKNTRKKRWQGNPLSPQPLLLLLSQLHVPLDHFQDVLRLVVRQARQVQLPAHRSWPRHAELLLLLVQEGWTRRGTGAAAPGAEAGTTLEEDERDGEIKNVFVESIHSF